MGADGVESAWKMAVGSPVTERQMWMTCPTCGREQRLHAALVDQSDPFQTIYQCRRGCGVLLIISTPRVLPWNSRGYRVQDWLMRNRMDLFVQPPDSTAVMVMLIPAARDALNERRAVRLRVAGEATI
jgi:hypothetical protein